MIDPACGSGHFLLGASRGCWTAGGGRSRAPRPRCWCSGPSTASTAWTSTPTRWRSPASGCCWRRWQECGVTRLGDAPDFAIEPGLRRLAAARQPGGDQGTIGWHDWTTTTSRRTRGALARLLRPGPTTPWSPTRRTSRRRTGRSTRRTASGTRTCHMKYSLAVPFMQRISRLAV